MPPIFLQVKIWRNELYCRVWSCFAIWSPFPGSLEIGPLLPCRHARQSGRLHRSQAIFAAEEEVGEQCACHRTGQVQMCPHFMEYDSEASSLPWTWHLHTFLVPFIILKTSNDSLMVWIHPNEAHEVIWIEHEATPAQLFSANRVNMWPEIGIESTTSSCPTWDQSNQPTIIQLQ